MAAVRYTAIRWAREVPTLLHRGRVDRLGHHLLLLLATYAKNDGSDMYASVTSLAKEVHDAERDVFDALGRLETAGLIRREHASNGAPGWSLNLDARAESDSVAESRLMRRRAADRERQRRRRKLLKEDSHAEVDRDVTQELPVTSEGVTQESGVSHAEVDRDIAVVTQELPVSHASMTVTTAGQSAYNSLQLHKDRTPKDELPADADASGANELALDGITPTAKPAKRRKAKPVDPREAQAQELASAYYEAMNHQAQFMGVKTVVKHALTTFAYDQVRAGLIHMSSVDRYRPLTRQTLLAAIEAPTRRPTNGHTPYRNPADQNEYDKPLIARRPHAG